MYYLADICFMCLKNNIKLQSVFIQDNDGIVFNEKLRSCFPELINSTPDAHKLACSECLEKLRFLYNFKLSGLRSNTMALNTKHNISYSLTVVRNYLDKLQYENKTRQQLSVVLPARKRRKKVSSRANFSDNKVDNVGNSFKRKKFKFNSTNEEQLNTVDHSCQPTANGNSALSTKYNCLIEEKNLKSKIVEKVVPVIKTKTIYKKQKPQFCENDSTKSYLDKEAEDLEGINFSNEDDPNFEMSAKGTSRSNDYNNQKVNAILNTLKPCYVSDDSAKFCNTCQDLLFEDLNNINVHLHTHIQSSNCSRCEDSLEEIKRFQRHMFNHCETIFEMLDKGDHGEKFSCDLCDQQFDEFSNLKKHILDKHIKSLKCVVCSKTFAIKRNLLRHILEKHCHAKLYKCKICPTRFTNKEYIKDHMINVHYSDKVSVCKYCYQTFRNQKILREHITKHHEEDLRLELDNSKNSHAVERFSCAICQQQFNNVANLKRHIYENHIHSMKCDICSKTYQTRISIVRHILVKHCGVKLFECSICCIKYIDKPCFKRHMNHKHNGSNTNTKPEIQVLSSFPPVALVNGQKVTCAICLKQFDSFESLKQHIYDEHMTGLNCVVCSKTYSCRTNLNHHIMEIHCHLKIINCKLCPQQFACKDSNFEDDMNQQHSSDKFGAVTELDKKVGAVTELDNKVGAVTELDNKVGAVTELDNKIGAVTELKNEIGAVTELDNKIGAFTDLDGKVGAVTELDNKIGVVTELKNEIGAVTELDNKIGAVTELKNEIGTVTELDNKIGAFTDLDGKVGAVTELDNKVGAFTELDNKVGAVIKLDNKVGAVTELDNNIGAFIKLEEKASAVIEPEEIFIKEDPCYSDEYYSSDEEHEADNYQIEKDLSNFAMAEESNSRTSNSSNLQESVGSSVIPIATAIIEASYCEPGAPVDQSDVCDICQKMFLYLSNLSEHLNTHKQESSCSMCKDSAENISRLQRHMLTPCGNTNTPPDSANTANTRTNDKVTCVVCKQKFKFNILKKHMYTHITNSACVVCNKTIINKTSLSRHLLDHCNFKPFSCEICDRKYLVKEGLKYHMNTVHYSQVVCCQHCQKTWKCYKSLRQHIIKQHPENTYRCEVCKMVFLHKNKFEKHAKLHTSSQ